MDISVILLLAIGAIIQLYAFDYFGYYKSDMLMFT